MPADARVAVVTSLLLLVLTGSMPMADDYEEREVRPGDIDPADVVRTHPDMPARGTTKEEVLDRLGEPRRRTSPVGDPPISSWAYGEFTVYFEHDRVLHSVIPGDDPDG